MNGPLIRSYQVDITGDPPKKHSNGCQWWAVLRRNGALHVRKYLGQIAMQDARASCGQKNVILGPFLAKDAAEARRIAEGLLDA